MFERSEFINFSRFNCFLLAWAALFCELFWCQKSGEGLLGFSTYETGLFQKLARGYG